jgi:hypothetical protein
VDGWSVYEFDKIRTEAALMDFLRGGYKKQDVSLLANIQGEWVQMYCSDD